MGKFSYKAVSQAGGYVSGVISLDGWTVNAVTRKEHREFVLKSALVAFEEELGRHQIQMPPEFVKLVDKHFWDLV